VSGIDVELSLRQGTFSLDCAFRSPGKGVTAIFGPSGAGKSTVLRCVAGLDRPDPGRVVVNGACWQDSSRGRFRPPHRRPIGYVFQESSLFPHLNVLDNLRYAVRRRGRGADIDQVAEWTGIGSLLERSTDRLSGGERQRVAVARALVGLPEILLLDEPLASLDDDARREILPYLENLHRELAIPVLYVSHSRGEVTRLADHVVLLDAGRVRATGPVDEVLSPGDPAGAIDPETATVIDARVVAHEEEFGLTVLEIPGGTLTLPGGEHLRPGTRTRLRLLARDLSLTLTRPSKTSILNMLAGRVVEIRDPQAVLSMVAVDVGGTRVWARITRKSVVGLGLRPGSEVVVQVKSVALVP